MIIQLVLVPSLILAVVASLRSRASLRGQARRKIFAAITVVAGIVAVLVPNSLQAVANWTGVTRGTDLLLYGFALVIIYLVGSTSVRFREQESRMVQLARQVALAEAALRHVEAMQPRPGQDRRGEGRRGPGRREGDTRPDAYGRRAGDVVLPAQPSEESAHQPPVAVHGGVQQSTPAR